MWYVKQRNGDCEREKQWKSALIKFRFYDVNCPKTDVGIFSKNEKKNRKIK